MTDIRAIRRQLQRAGKECAAITTRMLALVDALEAADRALGAAEDKPDRPSR